MPPAKSTTPCPLSPALQKEIRRLKGKLHPPTESISVSTLHGDVTLPAPLAWLHSVEWPVGAKFQAKRPDVDPSSLEMRVHGVTDNYGEQFADRPFAAVTYDSGQFFYLAPLDVDEDDPVVYHVDHAGEGDRHKFGTSLSEVFKKYIAEKPPKAALVIPDPGLVETFTLEGATMSKPSLARITDLYIHDRVTDMTGIEYCTKLRNLHIERSARGVELRPVGKLGKLRGLSLRDVDNVDWLSTLASLTYLTIKGEQYEVPFASLPNLVNLTLRWTGRAPRLADLPSNIERLELRGPGVVDAIAAVLPRLTSLTSLDLQGQALDDLKLFVGAKQLQMLTLESNAEDISPLASLPKLMNVRITGAIASLAFLPSLQKLSQLKLYGTRIASLQPLAESSTPEVVIEGAFSDVSPAARSREALTLESDAMSDLSPLAHATFERLCLRSKRLLDLSALATTRIKVLLIKEPAFTDYAQLLQLTSVEYVQILLPPGARAPATKPTLANGREVNFYEASR